MQCVFLKKCPLSYYKHSLSVCKTYSMAHHSRHSPARWVIPLGPKPLTLTPILRWKPRSYTQSPSHLRRPACTFPTSRLGRRHHVKPRLLCSYQTQNQQQNLAHSGLTAKPQTVWQSKSKIHQSQVLQWESDGWILRYRSWKNDHQLHQSIQRV